MTERGLRVLGVARGNWEGGDWPPSQHDFTFTFLGLVGFIDPPRPDVPAAIAECRQAGVRLIMMTGDHPATAGAIARQVGLSERPEIITGPEIADVMTRPPRPAMATPFATGNLAYAVIQGIGMAAILLPGHWLLVGQGFSEPQSRVAVFTALVLGLFLLILSNRDLSRPAILGLAAYNPWIKRMFVAMALLLAIVLAVPFLREVMGFAPAGVSQLVAGLIMLAVIGLWLETLRRTAKRSLLDRRHE